MTELKEEKSFKDTLNLPSTTLAMRANAANREVEIQKFWEDNKIYEKMLENNAEFRDKIFFKNLLDTEKKIGIMDSYKDKEKPISHTFKEIKTENILRNIDNEESLIKKYTLRAQKINDENDEN